MLAGIGGCLLYNVVPATGPAFAFRDIFPLLPLPFHSLPRLVLEQIPVARDIPRNAIPSLHVAWVLLLYWNTRTLSIGFRVLASAYMMLTIFATLGTGEHYLVDLVASMPFALLVQAIVSPYRAIPMRLRVTISFAGLALTFGWLLLVRYATKFMLISPAIPWTLMVGSCVTVLILRNRLSANSAPEVKGEAGSTPIPAMCASNDAG
jgi:hypothetical protein